MSGSSQTSEVFSYVVLLCGSHVVGKHTLAISLSKSLSCPWLKAELAHDAAISGARSQVKKGYNYNEVFGRIFFGKIRRIGFLDGSKSGTGCKALMSCTAMRKQDRDAIRDIMWTHAIAPIFVIMHITKETLVGRTLGAEESELADRIMGEKIADIQGPLDEEEKDVVIIDSTQDVDTVFLRIKEGINRQLVSI